MNTLVFFCVPTLRQQLYLLKMHEFEREPHVVNEKLDGYRSVAVLQDTSSSAIPERLIL